MATPLPCRVLGCSPTTTLASVRTVARTAVRAACGPMTRTPSRSGLRCSGPLAPRRRCVKPTQSRLTGPAQPKRRLTPITPAWQRMAQTCGRHNLRRQSQVNDSPDGVSAHQRLHPWNRGTNNALRCLMCVSHIRPECEQNAEAFCYYEKNIRNSKMFGIKPSVYG